VNGIEVRELVKRYRGAAGNAVDGVSFDVAAGAFFCLLGPNGAGKTTTVSILTTTLTPTSGSVRIAGHDVRTAQTAVRRTLGVVFQQPSLDLNLTAEENIRLHAVLYGLYPWRPMHRMMPADYRRQVAELAGILGISDALGSRAAALSGGTRRKLELVRALMHRPGVLFLDEPTAGLDPESRRSLWAYLRRIRDRHGTTVFLTTHYLEEAETADTVSVMIGGRIVESGRPADVKRRHAAAELVLDATDRAGLRAELTAIGLPVAGPGPLRVPLDGRSVQSIVASIGSELTQLRIAEPTLEDVYLRLLDGARS
jgi:ABC-2 type transport system ATP-binding protein